MVYIKTYALMILVIVAWGLMKYLEFPTWMMIFAYIGCRILVEDLGAKK